MYEPTEVPRPVKGSGLEEGIPTSDPYPRMILVCMGISMTLIVIIFGCIFYDFVQRTERSVRPVRPPVATPAEAPVETPAS